MMNLLNRITDIRAMYTIAIANLRSPYSECETREAFSERMKKNMTVIDAKKRIVRIQPRIILRILLCSG